MPGGINMPAPCDRHCCQSVIAALLMRRHMEPPMPIIEQFSAGQVAKIVGVPYHQLNNWARLGVLVPSIDQGRGYDGVRSYSFRDVVALQVVVELRIAGLPLEQVATVAQKIQRYKKAILPTYAVGSANGYFATCEETAFLSELGSAGRKGLTWFLKLSDIVTEVREAASNTARFNRGKAARVA
jgi:DNA-binding transcriptional MerR regulator